VGVEPLPETLVMALDALRAAREEHADGTSGP